MNDSDLCVAGRRIPQDEVKTSNHSPPCLHRPQPGCTTKCLNLF